MESESAFLGKRMSSDRFLSINRLLFSSCGPAQWRLNGPDSTNQANNLVKSVPVTDMMKLMAIALLVLLLIVAAKLLQNPVVSILLIAGIVGYIQIIRPRMKARNEQRF